MFLSAACCCTDAFVVVAGGGCLAGSLRTQEAADNDLDQKQRHNSGKALRTNAY